MTGCVPIRAQSKAAERRAFTLLEVLLAVVIFSIVLVAIHVVFYGAVRLRDKTVRSLDASVSLRQALEILKRDLTNLTRPGGMLFGELQSSPGSALQSQSTSSGQSTTLAPLSSLPAGAGQVSPAFYTTVGLAGSGAPWGEVERVMYYLAEPTNGLPGRDLFRSVSRNLLPVLQYQPDRQWLMGGVETLMFSFYDGSQWRDTWDSTTETTALPLAIRVEIQMVGQNTRPGLEAPIQLVVPMALYAPTNQSTATTSASTGGSS